MKSVRYNVWSLGPLGFLAFYTGGVTLRFATKVWILRWSGYVPAEYPGQRRRWGRYELMTRSMTDGA